MLREFWIQSRKNMNLSQKQLADKMGIVYSVIGKIETGDRRLDTLETIKYCQALEINPCDLYKLLQKKY